MDMSEIDLLRVIIVTCVSMIILWVFKRQIRKVVTDLVTGSDSTEYQDLTISEIRDRIETRMDEVLK